MHSAPIAGIGLIVLGILMNQERTGNMDRYEMTRGYITDYSEHKRNSNSTYAPIYSYKVDGTEYTFESSVYTDKKPEMGKMERIMYDPSNPTDAYLKDGMSLGTLFLILGGMASFISLTIIITASCNLSDKWREFVKCFLLGFVFSTAGYGLCFGTNRGFDILSVFLFIFGSFGVYFIGYGFYVLLKPVKTTF